MTLEIKRSYLEIKTLDELKDSSKPSENYYIELIEEPDFQLNKFFYKNVGKKYRWTDRLIWTDIQWIEYINNKNLKTFVLKNEKDLAGYFELILHQEKDEVEIAYLGLLKEYQNKKLGSYLLSAAIKNSFLDNPKRVWVHTCSLDHKNALSNYVARGMKIFKTETIFL